jgi:hypothetical protein
MGLILRGRKLRLKPEIYKLILPDNNTLLGGRLRRLLGPDLSGPSWLVCGCPQCKPKESGVEAEISLYFRVDLHRQAMRAGGKH